VKRAKAYFTDGLPFHGLDKGRDLTLIPSLDKRIRDSIEKFLIIRNALAHKSKYSYKRFESEIIGGTALSNRERKSIGYLRGQHSSVPAIITRYEQIISEIRFISILITSKKLH
jgi:hypothetical protein